MRVLGFASRLVKALRRIDPHLTAIALTLFILVLHLSVMTTPSPEDPEACRSDTTKCAFVFDEAHYVPAVRKMLAGEAANNEHPPLSKFLMMLGMGAFGDNPVGWRIASVLTGTASVYVLFRLASLLLGSPWLGLAATVLFAFDVTSFNLSGIGVLDPPATLLLLTSAYFSVKGKRLLTGLSAGLGLLTKASSVLGVLAILVYWAIRSSSGRGTPLDRVAKGIVPTYVVLGLSAAVMVAGLAVYDYYYGAFPHPLAHLDFILSYHSSLTFNCKGGGTPFSCFHVNDDGSVVVVDLPLSWTLPAVTYAPMGFYVVSVSVDGYTYKPVAYYGMASPLWWTTWVVLAFSALFGIRAAWRAIVRGERMEYPGDHLYVLLIAWLAFNYLVFIPVAHLMHRWVYPFYFYQVVPLLSIGLVSLLSRGRFERSVLATTVVVTLFWFFVYYPVKSDLHVTILKSFGLPT
ncbi:MAG: glycosyltransferase family 39 protein [Thaumarchaeota archaeon]|nr:glycosyltransferase family 39 protein [Candidatus Calditenuaceae archaeon]MDW8187312.1 glycosyltransferase family 39 protein [Nitrososphaerota archaeon]